ncbi:MAG: phosphoglycerate kinase [Gammaproteobacteria bacterium]|jgi:phosphoglycerate kinase|nr:phosphoglycerate kinase [Gammaproteobacteria bacterium]
MLAMQDVDLHGKRVLIREDLNVPISAGQVTSDARLLAAIPTLRMALEEGAAVMVMSHLGRPAEGAPEPRFSLQPVAHHLTQLLGQPVRFVSDWLDGVEVQPGEIVLLENVRFCVGEKINDSALAARMAALCDVFVMDAFATAHRAQASTEGVIHAAPIACAGPLLMTELNALSAVVQNPRRPLIAIIGGAKVSTKLGVLRQLVDQVDQLITGGGIANTLLAAAGKPVGKSLYEPDMLEQAQELLDTGKIPLPDDVICASEVSATARGSIKNVDDVSADDMILDIGPSTSAAYTHLVGSAGTILWNGPLGVFELEDFAAGTRTLAQAIAASKAYSVAGGGDTLAAIDQFGIADGIDYQSTGGGAFLEFVEGKTLPAIAALQART